MASRKSRCAKSDANSTRKADFRGRSTVRTLGPDTGVLRKSLGCGIYQAIQRAFGVDHSTQRAMASISTKAPAGSAATWTVERAGGSPVNTWL